MRRFSFLLLAIAVLLSACAQAPQIDPDLKTQFWLEQQIAASAIQSWQIKGRVAVKNDKESGTVTLFWNQNLNEYELRFIAPLGQGTYILTGSAAGVVMQTAKESIIKANSAEQLLRQTLGWDVHLDGLKYWVRGLPEPDVHYSNLLLDDKGRLINLEQSGFHVSVSSYINQGDISLPKKIKIKSDKIQLKVAIQDWQI
ncbi:MAG: lipoprotein insertase outer membrane protein LolB [Gammaproteobacteria bacterium]